MSDIDHVDNKTPILLGSGDDPLVPITFSVGLQSANVTPGKCLTDSQADEFLPVQNLRNDLRLQLWRSKVENWGQADDGTGEET